MKFLFAKIATAQIALLLVVVFFRDLLEFFRQGVFVFLTWVSCRHSFDGLYCHK